MQDWRKSFEDDRDKTHVFDLAEEAHVPGRRRLRRLLPSASGRGPGRDRARFRRERPGRGGEKGETKLTFFLSLSLCRCSLFFPSHLFPYAHFNATTSRLSKKNNRRPRGASDRDSRGGEVRHDKRRRRESRGTRRLKAQKNKNDDFFLVLSLFSLSLSVTT